MRVLIADKLAASVTSELESAGCAVEVNPGLSGAALAAHLATAQPQVLVVRSTRVEAAHIDAAASLALVVRAGAGVDTIDVEAASSRGIYVANCPGKNAIAVAELAMGHLLNLDRRVSDNVAALRAHRWAKKEFSQARGLYGRSLAVLGTGRIGQEVIKRALAFGMKVRAWDKVLTPEIAAQMGVEYAATPRQACSGAHALTVHLPLTPETRGLVGPELLEALQPGALVINTARGGLVDEQALMRAAETRGIRAGLDVFEEEPDNDGPFAGAIADHTAVYGTHHIGASTDQATEAVGDEVVRIVRTYLHEGKVLHCVNVEEHPPATHLLVVRHADEVGVLAGVFELLREAGVNVQQMENVIFRGSLAACARIQLSQAPPRSVLVAIQQAPHVFAASLVALEDR